MKKKYILVLCFILLITACSPKKEENLPLEDLGQDEKISRELKNMSLEEKIGQLMIIGLEEDEFTDDLARRLDELKPGGLIFFSKNIGKSQESREFIEEIKKHNKDIPLFLAVDEEGGEVSRLPDEFLKTPSFKEIGESESEELAYQTARAISRNISYLGFNMNNGPVLDIRSNINNPITKTRSFSADKELVASLGLAYFKGAEEEGILSVVKHFPGHGQGATDPHFNLPMVNKLKEEIYIDEIYPFKRLIDAGVPAIMVGHVLYKDLDMKHPASQSKIIIGDILRGELAYDRLVISDDLTMQAITNSCEPEKAALKFIAAGGDMALLCHGNQIGYHFKNEILKGLKDGRISEGEIDERVGRIIKIKKNYDLRKNLEEDIDRLNQDVEKLGQEIEELRKYNKHIGG